MLDGFFKDSEDERDLLYSIVSNALALNKEGMSKVSEYMLDISKIIEYQNKGARIVSKKLRKLCKGETTCPEDVQQTEVDCNPDSDLMDDGNADTRPE